jgi:hypothetical protein
MKCIECKWYAGQVNDTYGVCKRFPQIANKSQNDWCGEYLSKIDPISEAIVELQAKRGRKPKQ